ncbi:MAG: FAD binding domain-containing protein [Pseudomonadota bacterium]
MLTVDTYPTLAEAAQNIGPGSRFLGGGTIVMRSVNYGDQSFNRVVRTTDPALKVIRAESSRVTIGVAVRMADVIASSDLDFLMPAARGVGGPAVRNMATVGGNLFAAHPYGDFTTALLALDATVRTSDGREQLLETFLADRDRFAGLVESISVARPMRGDFRFAKVSRVKPKGVSVLSVAAWLPKYSGRMQNARVAFGAMGPTPLRAKAAEQALEGATLDDAGVARALDVACEGLSPADDALASAWYRREVAPVHLKRLLLERG